MDEKDFSKKENLNPAPDSIEDANKEEEVKVPVKETSVTPEKKEVKKVFGIDDQSDEENDVKEDKPTEETSKVVETPPSSEVKEEKKAEVVEASTPEDSPKKEKKKLTPEQKKKAIKKAKKEAKMRKTAKHRVLKNIVIWCVGVIWGFVLIFGTPLALAKFVPLKTFVGEDESVVSKDISQKSLIDAILGIKSFNLNDFPVIVDAVDGLLNELGFDGMVEVDKEKIKNINFSGSGESTFADELKNCIKIKPELFGEDLSKLSVFSFDKYGATVDQIDSTAEGFTPQLYYYLKSGTAGTSSAVYARAFNDDKTLVTGASGEAYLVPLTDLPLGEMLNLITERFGFVKMNNVISILGGELSVGIEDIIGDIAINELETFDFDDIYLNKLVDESGEIFNIIYNSIVDKEGNKLPSKSDVKVGHVAHSDKYNVTFSVDNVPFHIVFANNEEHKDIYNILKNITGKTDGNDIKVGDLTTADTNKILLKNIIGDNQTIMSILSQAVTVDGSAVDEDDLRFGHVLQADGYGSTFSLDGVKLTTIVKEEGNTELYDTLKKLTGETNASNITIGSLKGKDVNDLLLKDLIDGNSDVLEILCQAVTLNDSTPVTEANLTLGMIANPSQNNATFSMINIKLSSVFDITGNESLYGILEDLTGISRENITLNDLNEKEINTVKISNFINPDEKNSAEELVNADLYKVLKDLTGKDSSDITVGDLNGCSIGSVKISTFIDPNEKDSAEQLVNADLYKILKDMTGKDAGEITVQDLNDKEITNIKLSSFLDATIGGENDRLYQILCDAKGFDATVLGDRQSITVGQLDGLSISGVRLSTVITKDSGNQKLFDVIAEATQTPVDDITVGSIEAGFDINRVSLSTVLGTSSSNSILNNLIAQGSTIGSIATDLDGLGVSDLFEDELIIFTQEENGTSPYKKVGDNYELVTATNPLTEGDVSYYLSDTASVWLFLCYTPSVEIDAKGYAMTYTWQDVKFSGLHDRLAEVPGIIMNTTIRQLLNSGVLTGSYSDFVCSQTIQGVIDFMEENLS